MPARSIASRSPARVLRLRDTDARAQVGRLHEHRESERAFELGGDLVAPLLPRGARRRASRSRAGRPGEQDLHQRLVHAERRRGDARADVWHVRELEQALDGAVLAVRSVQHREDHVDVEPGDRASLGSAASGARLIERIVSSPGPATRSTSRPVLICRAASTRDCSITSAVDAATGGCPRSPSARLFRCGSAPVRIDCDRGWRTPRPRTPARPHVRQTCRRRARRCGDASRRKDTGVRRQKTLFLNRRSDPERARIRCSSVSSPATAPRVAGRCGRRTASCRRRPSCRSAHRERSRVSRIAIWTTWRARRRDHSRQHLPSLPAGRATR